MRRLTIGAWNVRTLLDRTGTSRPERRRALVDRELSRYKVDIAALSETRYACTGQETEKTYTFFWSGKSEKEKRESGVGFAIKTSLVGKIEGGTPKAINDRLMTVRLPLAKKRFATFISVYAPTMQHTAEFKEQFYSELRAAISDTPKSDKLVILGDFNARVGTDSSAWEGVLGKHGVGKCNSNGQLLLELCMTNDLLITNTVFQLPQRNRTSWMHPRSKHWHLIDYVLVRQRDRRDVRITKSMCGADCWTDHRLLVSKMNMHVQPHVRPQGVKAAPKKLDVNKLSNPAVEQSLQAGLAQHLGACTASPDDVPVAWQEFTDTVQAVSKEAIGTVKYKHQDWFDENDMAIQRLIDNKHKLFGAHVNDPTNDSKRDAYRSAKQILQRELRHMQDSWFSNKAKEIEAYAASNNSKQLYASLQAVYGRQSSAGSSPLLDAEGTNLLTDKEQILNRWSEHFDGVLNRPSSVNDEALDRLPQAVINEALAKLPELAEIEKAISSLSSGKSPGDDGIPAEVFSSGGPALVNRLLELFQAMWTKEELPQEMKDASVIHLYKKKGNRQVCDNHRGISLLVIGGKILARILLDRLQAHLESADQGPILATQVGLLPETQCGFRQGRGTIDMIFTARQLQEKCREQNVGLYTTFIDLTKAFDTVSREGLWKVMSKFGCPTKFINMVRLFHDGMQASVRDDGKTSKPFPVTNGVKQGCVLAPTLFSMYFTAMLSDAFREDDDVGIKFHSRIDGGFYKPQRLKTHSKVLVDFLRDVLFADDCALCTTTQSDMQHAVDLFARACKDFGLTISIKKTEVMYQPPPGEPYVEPYITIQGQKLVATAKFPYLGSTMSNTATIDDEINLRVARASASFGRLRDRVWNRRGLSFETKLQVYRAVVLPSLLYGSETWTVYARHERQLQSFHMRCLRQILRVKWQDCIPDTEILQRSHSRAIGSMLMDSQLRWAGHVARMPDHRLPKRVFFGELCHGQRSRGRPKKRYKDTLKVALNRCDIRPESWEEVAQNRNSWRTQVKKGVAAHDRDQILLKQEKRRKRKEGHLDPSDLSAPFPCPHCDRSFRARIAVISHCRHKHPPV